MSSTADGCPANEQSISEYQKLKELKPCCACPETRQLRDNCVFMKGEESCHKFIEQHKECLRSYGFKL